MYDYENAKNQLNEAKKISPSSEENITIEKMINNKLKENEENKKIKNEKIMNQKLELKNKYKYHDRHMNNFKKKENKSNPSCRKYNPKYDSILKVPQSIPSWEKQLGRKPPKIKEICDKFYIEHDNIIDTMAGTAFIDMSKQIEKQSSFENKENIDNKDKVIINVNNKEDNKPNNDNNDNENKEENNDKKITTNPKTSV